MSKTNWKLQTSRLQLRKLFPSDLDPLVAYRNNPVVSRYQSWEGFTNEQGEELIREQSQVELDTPGTWAQWALVLLESERLIGDCGIHFLAGEPRQVELGITLSPAYQGRGLAKECLARILDFVFDSLGKHRATAVVDQKNKPAAKLFRSLGFRQEGNLIENVWFKGAWGSEFQFGILNREWKLFSKTNSPGCKSL